MNGWSVLHALWLFLPAYVANMSPVFTAKMFPKWGRPIDGGRLAKDGERLLGNGKTWRGLFGGALFGGLAALGMAALAGALSTSWLGGWDFGVGGYAGGEIGVPHCPDAQACTYPSTPLWAATLFGAVVGFFALAGDAIESYAKRRSGRPRGAPWFPFDQLDFVVFGLLGMIVASPLLVDGWLFEALFGDWIILATLIIGTPALHISVNRIGYWLKLKEVPW